LFRYAPGWRLFWGDRLISHVNVFRASEYVPGILESCIKLGINKIWLQEGIINLNAEKKAHQAGVLIVMDRCIYKEIIRLGLNLNSK
jgi:predicted CoA-binding protein